MTAAAEFRRLPVVAQCAVIGSLVGAPVGGIVGLILGIRTYVPTAWFAVLEVGVPGMIVGTLSALLVGTIVAGVRALAK